MWFKTYCRNVVRSFYDAAVYREAITEWKGFGGRYILFVSAIIGVFLTIMFGVALHSFNTYELPYLAQQIPNIQIKKHVLSVEGPDPTTISTKDKNFLIIIDTKSSEWDLSKKDAHIIMGKNFILLKQINGYKQIALEDMNDYSINKDSIIDVFHKLYMFLVLILPLSSLGQALTILGQVLIVALLSYAITAAMPEEYYFEIRMRLAALSVTPPFIISKFASLFGDSTMQTSVTKSWFGLLLALLYFYVMIMLIRRLPDEPTKI